MSEIATADPGGVAVIFATREGTDVAMTWSELDLRSTQIARALNARGVHAGDRVSLRLGNTAEMVSSRFSRASTGNRYLSLMTSP